MGMFSLFKEGIVLGDLLRKEMYGRNLNSKL
jgi:hypothetical protein